MEREVEKERERIIQKLKENGCRITKQRLEILDVILENHCSSCKEIFFYASKRDEKIGIATVYRMSALWKRSALSAEKSYMPRNRTAGKTKLKR